MSEANLEQLKAQMADIEITLSFQDDTIEAMQKTVAVQHQEIQALQKQLRLLSEYIKSLREEGIRDPSQEVPPPHY